MNWCDREPALDEILSDSIVRAMMEAGRKLVWQARSAYQPND
jgi:hypothetical protein